MEDPSLQLSDNLLYMVYRLCELDAKYVFPATSCASQSDFDERYGTIVFENLRLSLEKMMFVLYNSPFLWILNEESFGIAAEKLKRNFSSPDQCFRLMLHVAMVAVFFGKLGKKKARLWAFRIISRHARQCDLRTQCFYRKQCEVKVPRF